MSQAILSVLVTQAWQVALIAITIAIVTKAICKDRPHLAHVLWLLVLLKCLTPPVFSSPTSAFSWLGYQAPVVAAAIEPNSVSSLPRAFETRFTPPQIAEPTPQRFADATQATATTNSAFPRKQPPKHSSFTEAQPTASLVAAKTPAIGLSQILISTWLIGAAVLLAINLFRIWAYLYWLSRLPEMPAIAVREKALELQQRIGLRRKVRIKVLEAEVGPAVIGIFRPTLILPGSILAEKSMKELEPILGHEMIHIRRGDLIWSAVQIVSTSLLWFHPLVWLASKMVTRESERSCDEETIASLDCDNASYARSLIEILEIKHRLRVAPALPGVRPVDITTARLERVMKLGNGVHKRTPVWIWGTMIAVAIVILPGGPLTSGQEKNEIERSPQKLAVVETPPLHVPTEPSREINRQLSERDGESSDAQPLPSAYFMDQQNIENDDQTIVNGSFDIQDIRAAIQDTKQPNAIEEALMQWLEQIACEGNEHSNRGEPIPNVRQEIDRLEITATVTNLSRCTDALNEVRSLFKTRIVVETAFSTLSSELSPEVDRFEWVMATPKNAHTPGSSKPPAWTDNGVAQASFERDFTEPFDGVESASFIHRRAPLLYAFVDREVARKIAKKAGFEQSPTITTYDGQFASICEQSLRPFVTSVKKITSGKKVAIQPMIEVVGDGTTMGIRPTATENGSVKLDCVVNFSRLTTVTTSKVPIAVSSGGVALVQNPNSSELKIRFSKEIPADKSLVVRSSRHTRNAGGETGLIYSFFHCKVVKPSGLSLENVLLAKAARINEWKRSAERIEELRVEELERKKVAQEKENKKRNSVWLIRNPDSPEPGSKMTLELPDHMNLDVTGDFEQVVSNQRVQISGKLMKVELASVDSTGKVVPNTEKEVHISISGQVGEFLCDRTSAESVELNFKGDVTMNFAGFEVTANLIEFSAEKFLAQGDVKFESSDEMSVECTELRLDHSTSMMHIKGNAKLTRESRGLAPPMTLKSDEIEWNMETGEIKTSQAD
jgi:beta-lactamase regulating signal transducer with metallopeptidase domain